METFNKFSTLRDAWHATIQGGGYLFQVLKFKLGDYVYFHQTYWLLWIWLHDVLFCGCKRFYIFVCYCWMAKMVRHGMKHVCNCASCHLPNVDGQIDPCLALVPTIFCFMLCGQFARAPTMSMCDQSSRGWCMGCFTLPFDKVPIKGNSFAFNAFHELKILFLELHSTKYTLCFFSKWFTFVWGFEGLS
jgi:hypothetical protein